MAYVSEFRWLCRDLQEEAGRADPARFLQNWLSQHYGLMKRLEHLRRFDSHFFDQEDLWSLYALSRVSDVFLSKIGNGYQLSEQQREELLVNRLFIKCEEDNHEYWPYDDCFVVRRDASLW